MRKDNWTIIGVTAIGGAFALFLRWLQNGAIFDPETGLATPNAAISWILALLCVAVALIQLVFSLRQRYRLKEVHAVADCGKMLPLFRIVHIALSALSAIGGILLLAAALRSTQTVLLLCLSVLAIGTGLAMLWLALKRGESSAMHCLCYSLPVIFYCLWLIVVYKDNASNATLWSFCPQILAISAAILAWFFSAGQVFEKPQPTKALFFSQLATFLSILLLADNLSLGTHLLLLCPSLSLLLNALQTDTTANEGND